MNKLLKSLVKPIYGAAIKMPWFKNLLARAGARHWDTYWIHEFIQGDYGKAYGITRRQKVDLVQQFERNTTAIQSRTYVVHHVMLARAIFSMPPETHGHVVECGCWKGASSSSLSLICRSVGRRLLVCDSFQGLPEEKHTLHVASHAGFYGYYKEGMFCGRLDEVKENVRKYGAIEVCDFLPGFFDKSLPALKDPIAFAFLDVDLVSSTQDCLRYIRPLLCEDGFVYTDDAVDLDVVAVFFDQPWWQETLGCSAPGYVGSGCGLPLNPNHSSFGYVRKMAKFDEKDWRRVSHLHYPEARATAPEPKPAKAID